MRIIVNAEMYPHAKIGDMVGDARHRWTVVDFDPVKWTLTLVYG